MGLFSWLFSKKREDSAPAALGYRAPTERIERNASSAIIAWRPGSFPMEAVGESHYQTALSSLCGGHNRVGHELEVDAQLVREPHNPHDPNAVLLMIRNRKVGYLPRDQAKRMTDEMNYHGLTTATCRAKIKGGWRTNQYDEGGFGVRLAIPNSGPIDFGNGMVRPKSQAPSSNYDVEKRKPVSRPAAAQSGPLLGHRIAIMGARDDGPEATQLAHAGARIVASVGKTTTFLVVVGEEPFDIGTRRSRTFQAAEEMIAAGSSIKIVSWVTAQKWLTEGATIDG